MMCKNRTSDICMKNISQQMSKILNGVCELGWIEWCEGVNK